MNYFLKSATTFVHTHGEDAEYIKVVEGLYDVETGSALNTETRYTTVAYKKRAKTNQFKHPDLVGKEVVEVIVVRTDLPNKPAPRDRFEFDSGIYVVDSVTENVAHGVIITYNAICYKV